MGAQMMLVVYDGRYCFTFVDIAAYGGTNDASILSSSAIGNIVENTLLGIPGPSPYTNQSLSFVVLGDDIFPLGPWLMKPLLGKHLDECGKVYNYRLSRAWHTIENPFGIRS